MSQVLLLAPFYRQGNGGLELMSFDQRYIINKWCCYLNQVANSSLTLHFITKSSNKVYREIYLCLCFMGQCIKFIFMQES